MASPTDNNPYLDVSQLEPPEPMTEILDALDVLQPGHYLHVYHRREPFPLYNLLQDMNMKWRQGQLYISITSILLSDKDKWYEMPVREIESIHIEEDSVPKVRFAFKSYDVTLTSKNMDQLRALRHFLMPFI